MKYDREARRCALQAMYQFDASGLDDLDAVRETLDGSGVSEAAREKGYPEAYPEAYPGAAREKDAEGRLPLHIAALLKAPPETVGALLEAFPEAARVRDGEGEGRQSIVSPAR